MSARRTGNTAIGRKVNPNTLKRLIKYMAEYKWKLILVAVCIILSAVANVAGSVFSRILIDDYITPLIGVENPVFTGLLMAIITMAVIYFVGVLAGFIYNRIMVTIAQGTQKHIRDDMFTHMQSLSIKYFDTHTYGDVMSRYTNDMDTLRQMLSQSIPQMFSASITIISVFIAMVASNIYLTIFVLLFVGFMMIFTKKIAGKSGLYFIKQQEAVGKVNGFVEEMINGQKVVKVFCHEEATKADFDEINDALCESSTNANIFANILMPMMAQLGNLQYVLLAVLGGSLAFAGIGGMTIGTIVSFLQLSKSFNMPISQISQQLNFVVMALAGAERIFELLDEEPEQDNGYVTLVNAEYKNGVLTETDKRTGIWAWKHPHHDGTLTYTQLKGEVRFYDVDFGYVPDRLVLKNITLYAEPGQKIAFVGATGAGKTTITNLINRFYDIADGKIRYDGININKIKKPDLRRSLGIVLQDTNLFTGTVMDNIRYGKLDATDEEVYRAAKLAKADEFIQKLPQGYDTVLTGNNSLSQGQCQLLSIARAAVADPPVMILDEATSGIDTRTEEIVQKSMDALMKGRTVFVIAHRLSTVQNSDVIMVLDHGEIMERGSHDSLMEDKGMYYRLYTGVFD